MADAMRWVVYALIEAEERGITQENLDEVLAKAEAIPARRPCAVFWAWMAGWAASLVFPMISWSRSFAPQAITARSMSAILGPPVKW